MMMKQRNSHSVWSTSDATTRLEFVCHYQFENGSSQFLFLDLGNGNEPAIVEHSLSFFTESFVQILASSNGFLLLSSYKEDQLCFDIFNPLTKKSTIIPQPCINHIVRVGLASDDGRHFQAVLLAEASSSSSSSFKPNQLELLIFSSDTGKWRKQPHLINLPVDYPPELEFQELKTPPLYSNGSIYWEIAGYLLVYEVKTSKCELHQLPNFDDWSGQSTMTYRRSFCESGGRVYYCYTDFDGFHIWDLLKEQDHYSFSFGPYYDPKKHSWRLVRSVRQEILTSKHQNMFVNWEPNMITPIAYCEHDQTMCLQLPGGVASYNLDTGNLRSVCNYAFPGRNFNCCLFLPFVTSGLCSMQREEEQQGNREIVLHLPIAQVETFSF